jgi:hypothetical protein
MTHAEQILSAAYELLNHGKTSFTREDIRILLGINRKEWTASFSPIFQGMRADQPGGAPSVGKQFQNVFIRIGHGIYILSEHGKAIITEEVFDQVKTSEGSPFPKNKIKFSLTNPKREGQTSIHPPQPNKAQPYTENVQNILENAEIYHQEFYRSEIFGNPCLYFHHRAQETRHEPISVEHLEYIYATLVAWGMNRPGKNGSKMRDFDTFSLSVKQVHEYILEAQKININILGVDDWIVLEKIFKSIKIMSSKTSLVGNSKVMHQILPNVIPPIDRKYTLKFLHGNTNIRNDLNYEWQLMRSIIQNFFFPIASNIHFQGLVNNWTNRMCEFPWDTSTLKIIDNILIGAVKSKSKKPK